MIERQVDRAGVRLRDHADGDAAVDEPLDRCRHRAHARRHVAHAERRQHDAARALLGVGRAQPLEHHWIHPRRHERHRHPRIEAPVDGEGLARAPHVRRDLDVQPEPRQRRTIGRGERGVRPGVALGGAIAAQQPPVEAHADLGNVARRQIHGVDEVASRVGPDLAERPLRAGQHHRAVEPAQRERQRRRGVGHGVGAVDDHHAVVMDARRRDLVGERAPLVGAHVRRVEVAQDPRRHLGQRRQLGHARQDLVSVGVGLEGARAARRHAERAAGVEEQDALLHRWCPPNPPGCGAGATCDGAGATRAGAE